MFVAYTTVANLTEADRLAADTVERNLAVCVQIDGPIVSHYRWQGQTTRSEEVRLVFKCLPSRLAALEQHVLSTHPYDTPEWLVVRAERVGEKYLSWAGATGTFLPFNDSQPPL